MAQVDAHRILIVDDEPEMGRLLVRGLEGAGYDTDLASNGIAALGLAAAHEYRLAVLDVMLPGMSGLELCRRLKEAYPRIAVILVTARDAVDDRVRGLDVGADDYLIKPFAFRELTARLRALGRRDALAPVTRIDIEQLTIDVARHQLIVDGHVIPMSRTEFQLLRLLGQSLGEIVSRSEIMREVWAGAPNVDTNIVDQYVSYLRRKLEGASAPVRIVTKRGVGYTLHAVPRHPEPALEPVG